LPMEQAPTEIKSGGEGDKEKKVEDKEVIKEIKVEKASKMEFRKSVLGIKKDKVHKARASTVQVYRDMEKESDHAIEGELKEFKSDAAAAAKFLVIIQELIKSLVPCLMGTPFVYFGDSWLLHNHADFRMHKRKALEKILNELNGGSQDFFRLLDEFEAVLIEVLVVRYPAMPDVYESDDEYLLISSKQAFDDLVDRTKTGKILTFRSRVRELGNILVQYFTYCPVGRPYVYVSDLSWTLASDKELRSSYRKAILR